MKILLLLAFTLLHNLGYSQNVGIGTNTPHPSAVLDIADTAKGVLIPRTTKEQRNAIANPAEGLLLYQINDSTGFWYFSGQKWLQINNKGIKGDKGEDGIRGLNSLIKSTNEPYGVNCVYGGIKIEYGFDYNSNGLLDTNEVNQTMTNYICNFANNQNSNNQPLISVLDCSSVTINGNFNSSQPLVNSSFSINYSGSNGLAFPSISTSSVGISGMTATLNSGNLNQTTGILNFILTGTPNSSGIAKFPINIGGQICEIQIYVSSNNNISIGSSYGGGIVAYIFQPGEIGYVSGQTHGIIVAPHDQGQALWGCNATFLNATSDAVGTGKANTNNIVSLCSDANSAAAVCQQLILNGFDDWFLPSRNEFDKIYNNLFLNGLGNFNVAVRYWTSTEYYSGNAFNFPIASGASTVYPDGSKLYNFFIRAARYF